MAMLLIMESMKVMQIISLEIRIRLRQKDPCQSDQPLYLYENSGGQVLGSIINIYIGEVKFFEWDIKVIFTNK